MDLDKFLEPMTPNEMWEVVDYIKANIRIKVEKENETT